MTAALIELGRRGVTSVLLEGGPTLAGAFLDAGEVDELRLFIAPIVIGGAAAKPLFGGTGAATIADAMPALAVEWERSDADLLVRARLREWWAVFTGLVRESEPSSRSNAPMRGLGSGSGPASRPSSPMGTRSPWPAHA